MQPQLKKYTQKIEQRALSWLWERAQRTGGKEFLTPATKVCDEDVFVVAYPKSGVTWLRVMMSAILCGADPELFPNELVNWLSPELSTLDFYMRWRTPMFFKSHELPGPKYKRVVYLVRDGRDVVVSYYHFMKAMGEKADFESMVKPDAAIYPCSWHRHVQTWLENPFKAELMIVRYEDLKTNGLAELKRICEFARLERKESFLKMVLENASFEKMREKESREGWLGFPRDKRFVRRGKVGSFKDEMPPGALTMFLRQSEGMLARFGYLQETAKLAGE